MVAILVSWIIALLVFYSFGELFIRLFHGKALNNYGLADVFFTGFSIVGALLAIASLWIPLTGYVLLTLVVFSLIYLLYEYVTKGQILLLRINLRQRINQLPALYKIGIILTAIVLIIYSLLPPLGYDTGLYHTQAMKWIESYPAVPGLGNIHGRFGFNSNTLLLHSVFSVQDIFGSRIFGLNSLLLLVLFSWIIFKIRNTNRIAQLALVLIVFVFLRNYDIFIPSPNTDLIPNIIILYLFLRVVFDRRSIRTNPLLYLVLPVFCLTLKLSVAPVCLFTLLVFVGFVRNKQYKILLSSFFVVCILFIPWCVRNVIISGYLIYPFPAIDIFDFDWKVPVSLVEREKDWVLAFAKASSLPIEEAMNTPFTVWGKMWLTGYFNANKTFFFVFCLALIAPFVVLYSMKRKFIKKTETIYPWLIALVGMLYWGLTAPAPRFALGFIVITAFAPFLTLDINRIKKSFKIISPVLLTISLVFFFFLSAKILSVNRGTRSYSSFLYKPQMFNYMTEQSSAEYVTHTLGNVTIYVPTPGDQCFDQELPCSPVYCYSDSLEMRGELIKNGFRVKTTNK